MRRIRISSRNPPRYAATNPTLIPPIAAMREEAKAIPKETRAP